MLQHCNDFLFFVFALDDAAYKTLENAKLKRVVVKRFEDIVDDEQREAREGRNKMEQILTCRPAMPMYCLATVGLEEVTMIDADCFFFYDPTPIYREIDRGRYDIAITSHHFPPHLAWRYKKNGLFNAGWIYFRAQPPTAFCLDNWRRQCME